MALFKNLKVTQKEILDLLCLQIHQLVAVKKHLDKRGAFLLPCVH